MNIRKTAHLRAVVQLLLAVAVASAAGSCSKSESNQLSVSEGDSGAQPAAEEDSDAAADDEAGNDNESNDAGETASDAGDEGEATEELPTGQCADMGFEAAERLEGESTDWGGVVGDFSVETTDGVWSLSDNWIGCDSFIFISSVDQAGGNLVRQLGPDLFRRSAPNVHYFFLTTNGNAAAGAEVWSARVESALAVLPRAADQEHWRSRVHFVTIAPSSIEGTLGDFVTQNPEVTAFGIDRAQTWDNIGSIGGFGIDLDVVGYSSRYYNFRYAQAVRLAAEQDVTEVSLIDNAVFAPETQGDNGPFSNSNQGSIWPAEFPDADAMAQFDTMELLVEASCGPDSVTDCGWWDYEAFIQLCDDPECATVIGEVARWIAPYSRPGTRSWVFQLSPLLGLLRQGGTQYFRFRMVWNMNPNTWNMTFRLRDASEAAGALQTIPAWAGNRAFDAVYNDNYEAIEFTPPEGTQKVELAAVISGHGQATGNCSEWCEHQHEFTVNDGAPHLREFPGQVAALGCAEQVDLGVVPGQYGNWTPGRAGWCPGLPIQPWVVDITDEVTIGQPNTISYRGLLGNVPIADELERGRIRLQTYLVYSQ